MKEKILFKKFEKRFLDTESKFASYEHATVSWDVSLEENKYDKESNKKGLNSFDLGGSIRLADCNRVINFDIGASNIEEIDARIAKVNEFKQSINNLHKALLEAKKEAKKFLAKPFVEKIEN
jgi:hypothetical protein